MAVTVANEMQLHLAGHGGHFQRVGGAVHGRADDVAARAGVSLPGALNPDPSAQHVVRRQGEPMFVGALVRSPRAPDETARADRGGYRDGVVSGNAGGYRRRGAGFPRVPFRSGLYHFDARCQQQREQRRGDHDRRLLQQLYQLGLAPVSGRRYFADEGNPPDHPTHAVTAPIVHHATLIVGSGPNPSSCFSVQEAVHLGEIIVRDRAALGGDQRSHPVGEVARVGE